MVLPLETPRIVVGLQTVTSAATTAGPYYVRIEATLPGAVAQGQSAGTNPSGSSAPAFASGVVYTVKQNGSTIYTSPAQTPKDETGSMKVKIPLNCAASDAIEIDITSSSAPDEQLNTVQSTIMIGQGL
jgi:hypothetical protein